MEFFTKNVIQDVLTILKLKPILLLGAYLNAEYYYISDYKRKVDNQILPTSTNEEYMEWYGELDCLTYPVLVC